ncbi:MAG: DEAD/DEAH box helicase [Desulfurococcaceae archaeon]|nr:DEAD/DEAH box helicase [Desulfurococcaceae archaeon]
MFTDSLTNSLNEYLARACGTREVGVIYERVEMTGEPEPGPDIYSLDLPGPLIRVLEKRGIRRLYRFQYDAYREILNGENVVIVAGTGTGKTEAFFIPLAKAVLTSNEKKYPYAIVAYPTKALARDQVKRFSEYLVYKTLSVGIYDGDTSQHQRRKIAHIPPSIIVSNPDMIHVGLVYSPHVRRFIENARFFVFDELHVYEGVLGSHLHHLVHRVKLFKKMSPQFIASSATIANPRDFAESIFEEKFKVVQGSLLRRGTAVHILVSAGLLSRWTVTSHIVSFLAENNLKFVVFVDSQQMAEVLARTIEKKHEVKIGVHRAGLSQEIRKSVEEQLRQGKINGVISTPTLELGIDIGTIDAVVMAAPAPSYVKYLQRAGRAGRRGKGYVITVLADDPIDAYYANRPEEFFDQELTPSIIEPLNEEVLKTHVIAYLLQAGRARVNSLPAEWVRVINDLVVDRVAKLYGSHIAVNYTRARRLFTERSSIRSTGPEIEVVDEEVGEVIATRELPLAVLELYPGAIYLYSKTPYKVIALDLEKKQARVKRIKEDIEVYTRPLYTVDIADYEVLVERTSEFGFKVNYSRVLLELVVDKYIVRDSYSGEVITTVELSSPLVYKYVTRAALFKLPEYSELGVGGCAEAYHAIEHATISASRVTIGAGLTDLGGVSYPSGDIAVYDAVVGGSGLSKLLYERLERTLRVVYEIVSKCNCEDGCPRCIYSPYCGNNNRVLSRRKALYVLKNALYRGKPVEESPLTSKYGSPLV